MFTIKLTTPYPRWPFARQTPHGSASWRDCRFVIDAPVSECDAWVVLEDLPGSETVSCPPENTLFLAFEHPEVRVYNPRFMQQFAYVLSCNDRIRHPGLLSGQLGFPWHAGVDRSQERATLGYDDFSGMTDIPKTALISTVCSNKVMTEAHRQRLKFTECLKDHFGPAIDVFGRGLRDVADKWDAVHPYRYHVVVENGSVNNWWTEKLADAYLGLSFPFYWGCANAEEFFPAGAFQRIDIYNPRTAIATIEAGIASDLSGERLTVMQEARRRILDEHNLFAVLSKICRQMPGTTRRKVRLQPTECFSRAWTLRQVVGLPGRVFSAIVRRD